MSGRAVRRPVSQNEHLWCVIKMRDLSATERLVAHTLNALCYVNDGERVASHTYLAGMCQLGVRTVERATSKLVAVGLFDRIDNRRGGYRGVHSSAKYRPRIPAWWNEHRPGTGEWITRHYARHIGDQPLSSDLDGRHTDEQPLSSDR